MPRAAKINAAIRACLDSFQPGQSPLGHLAAYVEQLHADASWTESEIWEVESAVQRILTTLVDEEQSE